MRFIKHAENLQKKRVREREEETEGGLGEGETEKKKGSTTRHQADSEQA